jgi:hypothetical protein
MPSMKLAVKAKVCLNRRLPYKLHTDTTQHQKSNPSSPRTPNSQTSATPTSASRCTGQYPTTTCPSCKPSYKPRTSTSTPPTAQAGPLYTWPALYTNGMFPESVLGQHLPETSTLACGLFKIHESEFPQAFMMQLGLGHRLSLALEQLQVKNCSSFRKAPCQDAGSAERPHGESETGVILSSAAQ